MFDDLPNRTFVLDASSLRYEGESCRTRARIEEDLVASTNDNSDQEDPDLLEDAVDDFDEASEDEIDLAWEFGNQCADIRLTRPDESFHGRCLVHVSRGSSLAKYFLRFLPVEYIRLAVIPAINMHASTVMANWEPVTLSEYLTWISLFIIMSTVVIPDRSAYWHKSEFAFGPSVDFSVWMAMERFEAIVKMHVFTTPDAAAYAKDKLYQLRDFMDAYNENLKEVLTPGKYLCLDESMNQWLGHGMPNLKKIPRKPHSIGQEWKTVADVQTCCIIRLDITGDTMAKKFDDTYSKTIATVFRLVEPWFSSGRTVVADSWFGSPAMVRSLRQVGLFSIMQIKKKRYWPRGMPALDMIESLGDDLGSVSIMKLRTDSIFIAALRDKKPKCIIATAGSTSTGSSVSRWVEGHIHSFTRPMIFEEYELNKGAVDIANNRRDNLPSFHDVMKTYRWEIRCLSFFLAIAEANAFSAYSYVEKEDGMRHFEFRWRLGQSLLDYAKGMNIDSEPEAPILRPRNSAPNHRIISLGKLPTGDYRRLRCKVCHKRTQNSCLCSPTRGICKDCYSAHLNESS
jgi:hypothetical protein